MSLKNTLLFLWSHKSSYLFLALIVITFSSVSEAFGIAVLLPVLMIITSDDTEKVNTEHIILEMFNNLGVPLELGWLLIIFCTAIFMKALLKFFANVLLAFVSVDVAKEMRSHLVQAISAVSWGFFSKYSQGEILNSLSIEAEKSGTNISAQIKFFSSLILVFSYLFLSFFTSWQVSLIATAIGGVTYFILRPLVNIAKKATKSQNDNMRSLMSFMSEVSLNFKFLKATHSFSAIQRKLLNTNKKIKKERTREVVAASAISQAYEPIIALAISGGLFVAITHYNLELAQILFSAAVFQRLMVNFNLLQNSFQQIVRTNAYTQNLIKTLSELRFHEEEWRGNEKFKTFSKLSFSKVEFSQSRISILYKQSFDIKKGEITVLTGPSGSGKTTCLDLICGLYAAKSGEVSVNGVSLDSLDMVSWRKKIGYVTQEPVIFNQSIAENVALIDSEIDEGLIEQVLKKADAWEFVSERPGGIYGIVGERGLGLSGGQRQRLGIARALYARPAVLILDEPTSALDFHAEEKICETMQSLKSELAIICTSHRKAVVNIADQVIVLRKK